MLYCYMKVSSKKMEQRGIFYVYLEMVSATSIDKFLMVSLGTARSRYQNLPSLSFKYLYH